MYYYKYTYIKYMQFKKFIESYRTESELTSLHQFEASSEKLSDVLI